MGIKRILLLVLVFFFFGLFLPKSSKAIDLQQALTSENSIVVKIQEGIEYFFAFSLERKVGGLEKHAEKRLALGQGYAQEGNNEKMKDLLQNYLEIKEKQNNLLGKTDDGETLESVAERTIEQQKTMEEIKNEIDEGEKGNVIEVQEQVVNQVAERIVEVNGTEGKTEFFKKVEHVWAPGPGPGGAAGVVVEGGTMQFAPGTSGGGRGGSAVVGGEIKFDPGTEGGGATQNIQTDTQVSQPGLTTGTSQDQPLNTVIEE